MKIHIMFSLLLVTALVSAEEEGDRQCGEYTPYFSKVFQLDIQTTFQGSMKFSLCDSKKLKYLKIETASPTSDEKSGKKTTIIENWNRPLAPEEYGKLLNKYESALSYNLLDGASGKDGSTWCLESFRGQTFTKGCFWTPSHDTKARGLEGIFELGNYLSALAGLDRDAK